MSNILPDYVPAWQARELTAIVEIALARGYSISVKDGEEWVVKQSLDRDTILAAMASTDNDTLKFRHPGSMTGDAILGCVWCVYGNGPGETFADYTANDIMDELVEQALARARREEREWLGCKPGEWMG